MEVLPGDLTPHAGSPPLNQKDEPLLVAPFGFHPNSVFVGMSDELSQLSTKLFNAKRRPKGLANILVHGNAGAGKTHLVRQYVYTYRHRHSGGVFWVDARTKESRLNCFWDIAEAVSLDVENETQNPAWSNREILEERVRKWFETRENWLLIFDGITLPDDSVVEEFRKSVPLSENSNIVYTSVDRTLSGRHRLYEPVGLHVKPLDVADAKKLLFKDMDIEKPTSEQVAKATELVRYYECLPLAIHAIGHRLSATGKPLEVYRVRSHLPDKRLIETYRSTIQDLADAKQHEALHLINTLCFLGHHIPVGMIHLGRKAFAEAKIEIRSDDGSRRHLDNTFATLIKYGLIERTFDSYPLNWSNTRHSTDINRNRQFSIERQDSSMKSTSSAKHGAIDIVKVHTVVQGFCRTQLRRPRKKMYYYYLLIAAKMLYLSYKNAAERITMSQGLVKDYMEYETHARRLIENLPHNPKGNLLETRKELYEMLDNIQHVIEGRSSPASSQDSFRNQKSVFDWSSSMSSVPDTPTSESLQSNLTDEKTESPGALDYPPEPPVTVVQEPYPVHPNDRPMHGSITSPGAPEMSPNLSQSTEVPTPVLGQQGDDISVTTDGRSGYRRFDIRETSQRIIKKIRGRMNLGDFRPVAQPDMSHSHISDATASSPSQPGVNSLKENKLTYANVAAGNYRRAAASSSGRASSSTVANNVDSATEVSNISPNLSENGLYPNGKPPTPNQGVQHPSRFQSRHQSGSSEGSGSGLALLTASNVPSGPNLNPLPYDTNIPITRAPLRPVIPKPLGPRQDLATRTSVPLSGLHQSSIPSQLPTGYSSQPMSRDASVQSEHSVHTEPSRIPPNQSPVPSYVNSVPHNRTSSLTNPRRTPSPMVDTRSMHRLEFGGAPTEPDSPASVGAASMSRASSGPGPGMIVRTENGMSQSLFEFGRSPPTEHIRFGELDPVNVEDARRRTEQYGQSLEYLRALHQGHEGYQPPQPPYPSLNLMPSGDLDQPQEIVTETVTDNLGNTYITRRWRSGSTPARPNSDGLAMYYRQ